MVEARSAALWGHWVADARSGAGPTATGSDALSHVGETYSELSLSAPIEQKSMGATSELFLLDGRSESSAQGPASNPVTLTGGCGVTTGSTGSFGSACSTNTAEARRGCTWTRNDEGEPADTPDEFKHGSRAGGT